MSGAGTLLAAYGLLAPSHGKVKAEPGAAGAAAVPAAKPKAGAPRPRPQPKLPSQGAGSRLAVCPLCDAYVHVALIQAHVDAHLDEPPGARPAKQARRRSPSPPPPPPPPRAEAPPPSPPPEEPRFRTMSGDPSVCGICLEPFGAKGEACAEEADAEQEREGGKGEGGGAATAGDAAKAALLRERHVLWPCQHLRQCGHCALRIWQQPKKRRACPWCKSRIDVRPRAFRPIL